MEDLPRLLPISDELSGAVEVIAVTAVDVAYWPRHFLHCHWTLCVDQCLCQCQVIVQLNLARATWLNVI